MRKLSFCIPLCAFFLSGCIATQQSIDDLGSQLNALNASLSKVQRNQADINAKMDTLSKSLNAHSENLNDFNQQLGKLSGRIDDLQAALDDKISSLGKSLDNTMEKERKTQAAMLPSKIYGDSYSNLMKKHYDRAAEGFAVYLEKYPKGELVESAYYYQGDSYAGLGKWQDAAVSYAKLLEVFPSSEYTAAARIKYAQTILKMPGNNTAEAIKYFQSVMQDFPGTDQAKVAKQEADKLLKPAATTVKKSKTVKPTTAKKQ